MQIFTNFKAQNLKLRPLLSLAQIYYCYYLFKFRVLMVEKLCFYKSIKASLSRHTFPLLEGGRALIFIIRKNLRSWWKKKLISKTEDVLKLVVQRS